MSKYPSKQYLTTARGWHATEKTYGRGDRHRALFFQPDHVLSGHSEPDKGDLFWSREPFPGLFPQTGQPDYRIPVPGPYIQ